MIAQQLFVASVFMRQQHAHNRHVAICFLKLFVPPEMSKTSRDFGSKQVRKLQVEPWLQVSLKWKKNLIASQ